MVVKNNVATGFRRDKVLRRSRFVDHTRARNSQRQDRRAINGVSTGTRIEDDTVDFFFFHRNSSEVRDTEGRYVIRAITNGVRNPINGCLPILGDRI